MREAEEKFLQGLERMKGKTNPEEFHIGSTESYRSCANMADAAPDGKSRPDGIQGETSMPILENPLKKGCPEMEMTEMDLCGE